MSSIVRRMNRHYWGKPGSAKHRFDHPAYKTSCPACGAKEGVVCRVYDKRRGRATRWHYLNKPHDARIARASLLDLL